MGKFWNYLRYTGPATVVCLYVSMGLALYYAQLNIRGTDPLSQLGVQPLSRGLFSGGLLIAAGLMMVFAIYLYRTFQAPAVFLLIVIVGQLSQVTAAILPYGGSFKRWHTVAAFSLAVSIPILMWLFSRARLTSGQRQQAQLLLKLELAAFVLGIGWFVLHGTAAPLAQALPAVVFHAWIIIATTWRPSAMLH